MPMMGADIGVVAHKKADIAVRHRDRATRRRQQASAARSQRRVRGIGRLGFELYAKVEAYYVYTAMHNFWYESHIYALTLYSTITPIPSGGTKRTMCLSITWISNVLLLSRSLRLWAHSVFFRFAE